MPAGPSALQVNTMIEPPQVLTVKKTWQRPTQDQIAAFQSVPTGFVADALGGGGALSMSIKPIGDGLDIQCIAAGPAITVDNGPADVLGTFAALSMVVPGDVLVAGFSGFQGCAAAGDRVMGMLKNAGGAGFVTDGPMRDYAGIVEVALPVWCTGLNPASPYMSGPGSVGLPINVGGQAINSGDMIVADRDGVVVVPFKRINEVIEQLETIKRLEVELDAKVADGLITTDAVSELMGGNQTRYV